MATKTSSPRPSRAWVALAALVVGVLVQLPAWYYNLEAVYGEHRSPVLTERGGIADRAIASRGSAATAHALELRKDHLSRSAVGDIGARIDPR